MPCRIRNTPQVFGPLNNECLLHTGITFIVPISANESIANCVKPLIEERERESVKRKTFPPPPAPAPLVTLLLVPHDVNGTACGTKKGILLSTHLKFKILS